MDQKMSKTFARKANQFFNRRGLPLGVESGTYCYPTYLKWKYYGYSRAKGLRRLLACVSGLSRVLERTATASGYAGELWLFVTIGQCNTARGKGMLIRLL